MELEKPNINIELSRQAEKQLGSKMKQCWFNSWKAVQTMPELATAYYVEGWTITSDPNWIVQEHGWVELPDGQIVDPTENKGEFQAYFPGLKYTKEEAAKFGKKAKELPLVWKQGWGGSGNPEYMKAYQEAMAWNEKHSPYSQTAKQK